jgi:hypothetical protein
MVAMAAAISIAVSTAGLAQERPSAGSGGTRVSINQGWRFQMGDPAGVGDRLLYDVRPNVTTSADVIRSERAIAAPTALRSGGR